MAIEYGYIRWRSTLTGKEGGGQCACSQSFRAGNPAERKVSRPKVLVCIYKRPLAGHGSG